MDATTYLQQHPIWWTLEFGFTFLCAIASLGFTIYLIGVLISCWAASRHESAARKRKARNHRVGGAISP